MATSREYTELLDAETGVCMSENSIAAGTGELRGYANDAEVVVVDRAKRAERWQIAGAALMRFGLMTDRRSIQGLSLVAGAASFIKGKWDESNVHQGWRDLWNKQHGKHSGSLGFRGRFNLNPSKISWLDPWTGDI